MVISRPNKGKPFTDSRSSYFLNRTATLLAADILGSSVRMRGIKKKIRYSLDSSLLSVFGYTCFSLPRGTKGGISSSPKARQNQSRYVTEPKRERCHIPSTDVTYNVLVQEYSCRTSIFHCDSSSGLSGFTDGLSSNMRTYFAAHLKMSLLIFSLHIFSINFFLSILISAL